MNESQSELQLTDKQWEYLLHRLNTPDAIADALSDEYHQDDVVYVAECIADGDWDAATCHNPCIRDAVLLEAVAGNTVLACVEGRSPTLAELKIARTLASRISSFVCEPVEFPEQ